MVNSGIKRLDSPLDHIDPEIKVTFAPLPKPRTYSFDLSAYRDSVSRLQTSPSRSLQATPLKSLLDNPAFAKPLVPRQRQIAASSVPQRVQSSSSLLPPDSTIPFENDQPGHFALPHVHPSQTNLRSNQPVPLTAMNLLRDIEAHIINWQTALHRVIGRVQALYDEGPMIDGWIESNAPESAHPPGQPLQPVRQRDVYGYSSPQRGYHPEPTYHVCGYTEEGEFWSRHCPADQIASVSSAISRYQKLQELLQHKRAIELNLTELAQTIMEFQGRVSRIGRQPKL